MSLKRNKSTSMVVAEAWAYGDQGGSGARPEGGVGAAALRPQALRLPGTGLHCPVVLQRPPSPLLLHQTAFPERRRLKPIFPVGTGQTWAFASGFWFFRVFREPQRAGGVSRAEGNTKEATHELMTCESRCKNHITLTLFLKPPEHNKFCGRGGDAWVGSLR